ncbi:MAG: flagellar M-ring protein FliF C-terminal domain-containing protein, partial [Pseudomonadota bacterium]
ERVNFEVSETEREVIRAPGAIKRVTVAVLVNDIATTAEDGSVTSAPRDAAELESLRELVASAVGFDEARGDVITIKSMQLQSTPTVGTEASTSFLDSFAVDLMSAIQMAVLAVVTLILGLFVVRPLLSRAPASPETAPAGLPAPEFDMTDAPDNGGSDLPPLTGEIGSSSDPLPDLPMMPAFDGGGTGMGAGADPVDRLRAMIGERQEETVEILRSWLEEKEENY